MRVALYIPTSTLQMVTLSLAVDLAEFSRGDIENIALNGALANIGKARAALNDIEAELRSEPVRRSPASLRIV